LTRSAKKLIWKSVPYALLLPALTVYPTTVLPLRSWQRAVAFFTKIPKRICVRYDIFHGCVYNILYEESEDILLGLYKSVSFVVQAIAFKQTGNYIRL
jgi:hypothetical protein